MTTVLASQEYQLTDRDFRFIAKTVREQAGICLGDAKRQMVYSRLVKRLRHLGLSSFKQYCELLDRDANGDELHALLNAITTNLTSFFREKHHFDHLLSELRQMREKQGGQPKRLRIWCSAASTGEEPYSIALTVLRSGIDPKRCDAKLLATDIDTNVLAKGEAAAYPESAFKEMTAKEIDQYSRPAPEIGHGIREFREEVRRFIYFKRLNLMHNWPMKGPFDVIFCRNVLIYFDPPTKSQIVDAMAKLLAPNGILYLGHSESLVNKHPLLELQGRTTYRRPL